MRYRIAKLERECRGMKCVVYKEICRFLYYHLVISILPYLADQSVRRIELVSLLRSSRFRLHANAYWHLMLYTTNNSGLTARFVTLILKISKYKMTRVTTLVTVLNRSINNRSKTHLYTVKTSCVLMLKILVKIFVLNF